MSGMAMLLMIALWDLGGPLARAMVTLSCAADGPRSRAAGDGVSALRVSIVAAGVRGTDCGL